MLPRFLGWKKPAREPCAGEDEQDKDPGVAQHPRAGVGGQQRPHPPSPGETWRLHQSFLKQAQHLFAAGVSHSAHILFRSFLRTVIN